MIKVRVWHENNCSEESNEVKAVYPCGMAEYISGFLREGGFDVTNAYLSTVDGLSESALNDTDVLIWWGHHKHHMVSLEDAQRVQSAVQRGMGVIFLHSAHYSTPFKLLMGTTCSLSWREASERERVWTTSPTHPIANGVEQGFLLEQEEMYGEFFDVPEPDELVFVGWFEGGNVFRSGLTYNRGMGKVFYFQPGHETYPSFKNKNIQRIIINAVQYVKPVTRVKEISSPCENVSLEPIVKK